MKFEGKFSYEFKVILADLLKFKICNLHSSMLEGSHQDLDVITVG